MKKFLFSLLFCGSLLCSLSFLLFPTADAAENPILQLLDLPAPPPPNPDVTLPPFITDEKKFYSKSNPPGDDAPIGVLMDYWRVQSQNYNALAYKVYPSDKVLGRLMSEFVKRPEQLVEFLNIFPQTSRSGEFVKKIYDNFAGGTSERHEHRAAMRRWMKFNTPYFSDELARQASQVADQDDYVLNHDALIALTRVDWEKAAPIVSRLYNDSTQKASQTAALWALYLHALESGDSGDTERYRDELKKIVSDRSLSAGVRDLALDALSLEKEWSGRDDWYLSLMEDETMLDLGRFTGLTTLITNSPEEKYIDRMIALLDSDNISVRSAAARNLLVRNEHDRADVVKALLPWLEDSKWLKEVNQGSRERLVQALAQQKIPESVPALISALDEKATRPTVSYTTGDGWAANTIANAANAVAYGYGMTNVNSIRPANRGSRATNSSTETAVYFPLREHAIDALAFQADGRAVPALRKLLNEMSQGAAWAQRSIIIALYSCGGYSIAEQVNAVEDFARKTSSFAAAASSNANSNAWAGSDGAMPTMESASDILVFHIATKESVDDDLATAVVNRILYLEDKEPIVAEALRGLAIKWKSIAVNSLLLRDLKRSKFEIYSIVRLLAERKALREKQITEVSEIRTANATAYGISACLLEDPNDFSTILEGANNQAKSTMLACSRLIRAPLPVAKVAEYLKSEDKLLALAAERYLESEDSPEARSAVLSMRPGEARIMGATTAFFSSDGKKVPALFYLPFLPDLFATVDEYYARTAADLEAAASDMSDAVRLQQLSDIETKLQRELKGDPAGLGIYNWRNNYVHVYEDRAVFSWHDDPARYRERALTKEEFEDFRDILTNHKAADLPPFLSCIKDRCQAEQLLMLGRNGGRRVFVKADSMPPLFSELDHLFEGYRRSPSTIKYWAAKDVAGLEVLFADDRHAAVAVWKDGADFRLLTADKLRQAEIVKDIEAQIDSLQEAEDEHQGSIDELRIKREYDSYAWFSFANGELSGQATQPADVPYIPAKDDLQPEPGGEQWKARAGAVEIRASGHGLYKVVGGKVTQIRKDAFYEAPVVTPNGRWAVVTKYDPEHGPRLVRVNLQTGREHAIAADRLALQRAIAFVPSVNRVIVGSNDEEYDGHDDEEDTEPTKDESNGRYWLLDPETGSVGPTRGDIRPLIEQTFRPLQPASAPFEHWAAVTTGDETVIGIYNSRTFNIKPLVKLPKTKFNSMDLWVDSSAGKAFFVYEGHLLSVPIKTRP